MICQPCAERADALPNPFAPPELALGCGEDCGINGCPCLHRGRAHRHVYGVKGDGSAESFAHEHDRGSEPHEHVLRDGGTEVKRTTFSEQLAPAEDVG